MLGTMLIAAVVAAPGELPFLSEMIALFAASAVLAWVCQRLKIVPIVGFLVAGVLIGPFGLGIVQDQGLVNATAEIGVILLLFTIGVEFSLDQLSQVRRFIVLGGGLQVAATIALVALVLGAFGIGWRAGVYTGCLVALSSTAIVLKLHSDRGTMDGPSGRISLGILILQDLAIVVMVLLLPILGGGEATGGEVALALLEAAGIIVVVLALGIRFVPRFLDWIARERSQELFLLVVVTICFGIAWILAIGGVSLALGAFLAGLVVSGSRFREHALGDILPLRTLFMAVFFASVGMLLDLRFVLEQPLLILGVAGGVAVLKLGVTTGAVVALRYPVRLALAVGIGLAQIGEFSLVLEQAGRSAGLSPAGLGDLGHQLFLAVAVVLMTATPFLVSWEGRLSPSGSHKGADSDRTPTDGPQDLVLIAGYGIAGRELAQACIDAGIPYRIVDLNPVSVSAAQAEGVPIELGDIGRREVLEKAGLHRARCLALTVNDRTAATRAAKTAKLLRPDLRVIVRVRYATEESAMREAGADEVVVEEREATERIKQLICT
jgi:CPA2 family monovalent cation:H+ antiporter-2